MGGSQLLHRGFSLRRSSLVAMGLLWLCTQHVWANQLYLEPLEPGEFVRDLANLLDKESEKQIFSICKSLQDEKDTRISVLTINSISDYGSNDVFTFTQQLANQWWNAESILAGGDLAKKKGVLFLISKDDQKASIALAGSGWERKHDTMTLQFIKNVVNPEIEQGNFASGIVEGIEKLDLMSRGQSVSAGGPLPWKLIAMAIGAIVLVVLIVVRVRARSSTPEPVAPTRKRVLPANRNPEDSGALAAAEVLKEIEKQRRRGRKPKGH